jgi:cyclopropane-fatty-acyl-phospholipid synthase
MASQAEIAATYDYLDEFWRATRAETLGQFNGIACVGAFEHFCSEEEYIAGRQEMIYRDFFRLCTDLLPPSGRLF